MAISGTSSIDVANIVSQLMTVERQPLTRLDARKAEQQTKLSAYGALSSAVSSFRSALAGLTSTSKLLGMQASVGDSSVLTASAGSSATPGTHSIEVTQLAQGQKLAAAGQVSSDTPLGTGTLTLELGTISGGTFNATTGTWSGAGFAGSGSSKTITIDSTNNTLTGLRDAINAAGAGVTASLINDGSAAPWRLVITSNSTGAAQSLRIGASGDASLQNLLAHDPTGTQNLSEKASAQNATLKVDGITISKASNTVTDVLDGVTLNLQKTNSGSPTSLSVTRDTAGAQAQAKNFVDSVNAMLDGLKKMAGYDLDSKTAGALYGDAATSNFRSGLRNILNATIVGAGSITSLSQLGIGFLRDGRLEFKADKFAAALAANAGDVAAAFASTGRPTDSLVKWDSSSTRTVAGNYALNVTQLATRGNVAGSTAANLNIVAGVNDTLDVTLDGFTASVTLTAGTYATSAALASEVATRINAAASLKAEGASVAVEESGGVLTLRSARYGATSAITLAGNGAVDLLGATPTATTGVNVSGTIGGLAGVGNGQLLTGIGGSAVDGLNLRITGGATGARGTVAVAKGVAWQLDQLAAQLLDGEGAIATRTEGLNTTLDEIARQRDAMQARLALIEERYRRQYTALDGVLSRMQATQTYLTGQLEALANLSSAKD